MRALTGRRDACLHHQGPCQDAPGKRDLAGRAKDGEPDLAVFVREGHHVLEDFSQFAKTRGGDDDGVAVASDLFRDAQEPAASILFEGADDPFALDLHLRGMEDLVPDAGFGTKVPGIPPVR